MTFEELIHKDIELNKINGMFTSTIPGVKVQMSAIYITPQDIPELEGFKQIKHQEIDGGFINDIYQRVWDKHSLTISFVIAPHENKAHIVETYVTNSWDKSHETV